jgi:hypothetical protein
MVMRSCDEFFCNHLFWKYLPKKILVIIWLENEVLMFLNSFMAIRWLGTEWLKEISQLCGQKKKIGEKTFQGPLCQSAWSTVNGRVVGFLS